MAELADAEDRKPRKKRPLTVGAKAVSGCRFESCRVLFSWDILFDLM